MLSLGDECPIGVFDSGIGGLSVLKEIHQLLPHENLIYVGDSVHAPYGDKSAEYVRDRSQQITEFLMNQGAKAIVIACNTATAEAADLLRANSDVPVIGLEPAIKPATQLSKNGVIGVLATQRTINSERLLGLTERYAHDKKVLAQACPGLVEQVEAYELSSDKTVSLLEHYIHPLLDQGVDALILGCTHYPFLLEAIRNIVGNDIEILETGKPVALQLQRVLKQHHLERACLNLGSDITCKGTLSIYNSSNKKQAHLTMKKLWKTPITIKALPELS
jgi:glutamate racemase